MKYFIVFFIAFFSLTPLYAQAPDTLWTKVFGGYDGDTGQFVQQTTDGGYIIAGGTSSFGASNGDVWLIRTDAFGEMLWEKTLGGGWGYSAQQTADGGYIIIGNTTQLGSGRPDLYLIKTDINGDTLWTRVFGTTSFDHGNSVQQTTDGGYIVTGYTYSDNSQWPDIFLVKTDSEGDTLWRKQFGGDDSIEEGNSTQQTTDGGFILVGMTDRSNSGYSDVWLIKTDSFGDTLWTRTYGDQADNELGYSVQQTTDGGFIITGFFQPFNSLFVNVLLIKTDSAGDTIWTNTYGGYDEEGRSVRQTTDGGYIITGFTDPFGAERQDLLLIRTDSSGDSLWSMAIGGSEIDFGNSVDQTTDGGYIVTGYTGSYGAGEWDVWLIRVASESLRVETSVEAVSFGEVIVGSTVSDSFSVHNVGMADLIINDIELREPAFGVNGTIGTISPGDSLVFTVDFTPSEDTLYNGLLRIISNAGVVKLGLQGNGIETGVDWKSRVTPAFYSLSQSYPNPFNAETAIEYALPQSGDVILVIRNMRGEEIEKLLDGQQEAGNHRLTWNASDVASGIYFYTIRAGGWTKTRKMVILK